LSRALEQPHADHKMTDTPMGQSGQQEQQEPLLGQQPQIEAIPSLVPRWLNSMLNYWVNSNMRKAETNIAILKDVTLARAFVDALRPYAPPEGIQVTEENMDSVGNFHFQVSPSTDADDGVRILLEALEGLIA